MTDYLGRLVGNYQLTRLLGQGGFAEVYLGVHRHLGTEAAIKLLHAPLDGLGEVEKFRGEAQTIARLIHPHIVRVLEFDIDAGLPYLVLDYAPGGSLRQRHPQGTRVPLALVVSFVGQISQALQYAHDQQVVHRDIKPENLLLGRHGEVLLTDFGISVMEQSLSRQQTREFAGTAAYAAPEQVQGHPLPASDQYALGMVVYEWLTGTLPFTGSLLQVVWNQVQTPPPSLRERAPDVPPRVEAVVLRALAKDPNARFASVQAFADALAEASQTVLSAASLSTVAQPGATPQASTTSGQSASHAASAVQPPAQSGIPTPPLALAAQDSLTSAPTLVTPQPVVYLSGPNGWQIPPAEPRPADSFSFNHPKPSREGGPRLLPILLAIGLALMLLGGGALAAPCLTGRCLLGNKNPLGPASTSTRPTLTVTPRSSSGSVTEFALPTPGRYSASPQAITRGPDGNLWFTDGAQATIGRITPAGAIAEFPLLDSQRRAGGITGGPDGNLWFTETTLPSESGGWIGRMTPGGQITEYPLPTPNSAPYGITVGPDGNLWFAETQGRRIGRVTPLGTITEFPLSPSERGPFEIVSGPDGNLWFTALFSDTIGRITPNGQLTSFAVGPADVSFALQGIAPGPDGNLWFTQPASNKIGRISPSGHITEFPADTSSTLSALNEITTGPDGNLWFTDGNESSNGDIGRITPTGQITLFPVSTSSSKPYGITGGPDGNVWFTEFDDDQIGRITTGK